MVNTVKEYDDFKTYIISVIGNALGDEMLRVISSYLNRYSLTLDDIFNEPDEIRNALYKLFGDNASRVEQELINALSLPTPINNLTHAIKL